MNRGSLKKAKLKESESRVQECLLKDVSSIAMPDKKKENKSMTTGTVDCAITRQKQKSNPNKVNPEAS